MTRAQPSFAPGRCIIPVVTDDGTQPHGTPRALRNLGQSRAPKTNRTWLDKIEAIVHLAIWTS